MEALKTLERDNRQASFNAIEKKMLELKEIVKQGEESQQDVKSMQEKLKKIDLEHDKLKKLLNMIGKLSKLNLKISPKKQPEDFQKTLSEASRLLEGLEQESSKIKVLSQKQVFMDWICEWEGRYTDLGHRLKVLFLAKLTDMLEDDKKEMDRLIRELDTLFRGFKSFLESPKPDHISSIADWSMFSKFAETWLKEASKQQEELLSLFDDFTAKIEYWEKVHLSQMSLENFEKGEENLSEAEVQRFMEAVSANELSRLAVLFIANPSQHKARFQQIQSDLELDFKDENNHGWLYLSADPNLFDIFERFLKLRVEPSKEPGLLYHCIQKNNDKAVSLLVSGDRTVSPSCYQEQFPCHSGLTWAIQEQQVPIVKILLKALVRQGAWDHLKYLNASGEFALSIAVQQNDIAIISLLSRFFKEYQRMNFFNQRTSAGKTPLYLAVELGYLESCCLLLDQGADPSLGRMQGGQEISPLAFALQKKQETIISAFKERNLSFEYPALHRAFGSVHTQNLFELGQALLELKQAGQLNLINRPNGNGATLLSLAVIEKQNLTMVKVLLQVSADPHYVEPEYPWRSALGVALHTREVDIAEALITRLSEDKRLDALSFQVQVWSCWSALFIAVDKGLTSIVSRLASIFRQYGRLDLLNGRDDTGRTPLCLAIEQGDLASCRSLVEAGADIQMGHLYGTVSTSPWEFAIQKGHTLIADYLSQQGAVSGNHALHQAFHAIENQELSAFNLALQSLNSVNEKDVEGYTLLHRAAMKGYLPFCQALIEKKPDLNLEYASTGHTALFLAIRFNRTEVAQFLIGKGAKLDCVSQEYPRHSSFTMALAHQNHDLFKSLLDQWVSMNQSNMMSFLDFKVRYMNQRSALLIAVDKKNEIILTQLLDLFSKYHREDLMSTQDADGMTALHLAIEKDYQQACDLLIQAKILLDKQDKKGRTPLYIAAEKRYLNICQALYKAGANLELGVKNELGIVTTPLDIAIQKGYADLVDFFEEQLEVSIGISQV